jgi:hypothetical protein
MEKVVSIWSALADFQSKCPAIAKDSTAGQGSFKYKYGSLPMIIEVIKPHMKSAGLVYTQPIVLTEHGEAIRTILSHRDGGEVIQSETLLKEVEFRGMNEIQSKGSVITYLRRYALLSILGIVPEDDDNDAAGETSRKSAPKSKSTNPTNKAAKPQNSAPAEATTAKSEDSKPWLNPKDGGKENPLWLKAVKYLADGGTMDEIKKKYRVGKANESKLQEQALTFDDLPFDRKAVEEAEVVDEVNVAPGEPNVLFDTQGNPIDPPTDKAPY